METDFSEKKVESNTEKAKCILGIRAVGHLTKKNIPIHADDKIKILDTWNHFCLNNRIKMSMASFAMMLIIDYYNWWSEYSCPDMVDTAISTGKIKTL